MYDLIYKSFEKVTVWCLTSIVYLLGWNTFFDTLYFRRTTLFFYSSDEDQGLSVGGTGLSIVVLTT